MAENQSDNKRAGAGLTRDLARRAKMLTAELIRRYHGLLPSFLELHAGSAAKPGPVFVKEAGFLHSLTMLLMPENILEIGVGWAGSTVAFVEALRKNGRGHIISVDINDFLIARMDMILRYHGLSAFSTIIEGNSQDLGTKKKICKLTTSVDMLFIDGDHSFEACRSDFEMYRDLVTDGGVIIFHDTGPLPANQGELVKQLELGEKEGSPVLTADGTGIYHRPDVARVVDWITSQHPEYSLLSVHTLAEPCCGMAVLQKTQRLFQAEGPPPGRIGEKGTMGSDGPHT